MKKRTSKIVLEIEVDSRDKREWVQAAMKSDVKLTDWINSVVSEDYKNITKSLNSAANQIETDIPEWMLEEFDLSLCRLLKHHRIVKPKELINGWKNQDYYFSRLTLAIMLVNKEYLNDIESYCQRNS